MNQAVLPIGMSDLLRQSAAKVFCPHCQEIYFPKSSRLENLDGAYFGTSFAHLFFLTYQQCVPRNLPAAHVPRIYGFKIHKSRKEELVKARDLHQKKNQLEIRDAEAPRKTAAAGSSSRAAPAAPYATPADDNDVAAPAPTADGN